MSNYDDYQSYVEDHTQFNKEVRISFVDKLVLSVRHRWMQPMHLEWMLCIKQLDIVLVVLNNSHYNQVHLKVLIIISSNDFLYFDRLGHIAGAFARHRYDLKTQQQQQQQAAALAAQQQSTDKMSTSISRGESTVGVVQQLVHHIQHHPHTSSSSQRASTSMSAIR